MGIRCRTASPLAVPRGTGNRLIAQEFRGIRHWTSPARGSDLFVRPLTDMSSHRQGKLHMSRRRHHSSAWAAVAAACTLAGSGGTPASALTGYTWKYRPVLVFAERDASPSLAEQRRLFSASRAGLTERNIVIVWVVGNRVTTDLGPAARHSATSLRQRFGAGDGSSFRVVLVGKDGGTKLVRSSPLPPSSLFSTIDAMPMRRDEMQRR